MIVLPPASELLHRAQQSDRRAGGCRTRRYPLKSARVGFSTRLTSVQLPFEECDLVPDSQDFRIFGLVAYGE